jgi:hypothetical protein
MSALIIALVMLLAPGAPDLPVPYTAVELVTANIPTACTCFNVAYGLEQVSGGDRPTFARTGILFQARASCSVEDVTPAEPWHSINKMTTSPTDLTCIDFPEYIMLFWTDRGGSPTVHWASIWKQNGTYGIFEDVAIYGYPTSQRPVVWLSTNPGYPGLRLEAEISLIEVRRFRLIDTPTGPRWIEANDPPPTLLHLPLVAREEGLTP